MTVNSKQQIILLLYDIHFDMMAMWKPIRTFKFECDKSESLIS